MHSWSFHTQFVAVDSAQARAAPRVEAGIAAHASSRSRTTRSLRVELDVPDGHPSSAPPGAPAPHNIAHQLPLG